MVKSAVSEKISLNKLNQVQLVLQVRAENTKGWGKYTDPISASTRPSGRCHLLLQIPRLNGLPPKCSDWGVGESL